MGVFIGILSLRMPEHMLGDGGSGYAIELCGCGMPEEVRVKALIDG